MTTLPKEIWIAEVYRLLCESQGKPSNDVECTNLYKWASSLAEEDTQFYQEGMTPLDAHNEEMSAA